ncbi:hypothetical protein DAEQUDRAFT_391417 [Daedalea quercina L-15889]|uniref:Uncharacterized protein n=1 Tax=Daedalea quercina L-15889 TaxID=1314783 RepID=A0A165NVE7_9APHY|nr:hypothetical protein DAEQUDRAFT_391417 [Daedalea quercina L-15889]
MVHTQEFDRDVFQKALLTPVEATLVPGTDVFASLPLALALGAGRRDAGLGNADEDLLAGIPLVAGAFSPPATPIVLAAAPAAGSRPALAERDIVLVVLAAVLCILDAAVTFCGGGWGARWPCCRFGRCTPAAAKRAEASRASDARDLTCAAGPAWPCAEGAAGRMTPVRVTSAPAGGRWTPRMTVLGREGSTGT